MAGEKILVVDDVKVVCMGVEAELGDAGYQVASAYSGKEAIELVKKEKFDIVFCDLVMPEMDGVETCQKIKEISPSTEVVLISGHPKELEDKRDAFLAAGGAEAFLRKPFQEGELLATAKKIITKKPVAEGETTLVMQGREYLMAGKYYEAKKALRKAIKEDPKNDKLYSYLGEAYLMEKDYIMAVLIFEKSSQINPNWAGNYLNQAYIYSEQGLYGKAIERARKAIEKYPNFAEAYRELGLNLSIIDKDEEAAQALRKAIELNPGDEDAILALEIITSQNPL
ncbi:MAG: response regulator [Elusimicrobiota bacterium]